jgi:DNA processing protein
MQRRTLSAAERRDWLRLTRTDSIGPVTFFGLLSRFGDAARALEALPDLAAKAGRRAIRPVSAAEAEAEIDAAHAFGARFIAACEPDYPQTLAALAPPPPVLCVWGGTSLFARPSVAIVGARNASAAGLKMARLLAGELGEAGWTVISGLARGIDGAAHQASLATGAVAAVAGGVASIWPPEHEALHHAIAEHGAVVSERPFGYAPTARDFPRRNRLISGLALGCVIVEAEERSGSLITARCALEQGREVLAVPGSPLEPRAAGPNGLIRQGATLVRSGADVLAALAASSRPSAEEPAGGGPYAPPPGAGPGLSPALIARVAEALSPTPMAIDEIARACDLSAAETAAALLELEIAGRAITMTGGLACSR